MAKKKTTKRRGNVNSTQRAHEIAARRREVAKLRVRGLSMAEVAERLGVSHPTIVEDMKHIEQAWAEHMVRDHDKVVRSEVEKLEVLRNQCLEDYYECGNRFGEIHQTAFMDKFIKLTERIHELLQLNNPAARQAMELAADEAIQVVEVAVDTREQAEAIQAGVLNFDDLLALQAERDGNGSEQ